MLQFRQTHAMETGEQAKPNPLNFGDSIGLLSLILGVLALVLTPPFWWKIGLLLPTGVGCLIFAHKSQWTHGWPPVFQYGSAVFACLLIGSIAVPQLRSQWSREHPVLATANGSESKTPAPAELSEIEKKLEEIVKNTAGRQPMISAAQMEKIKEIDQLLIGKDENTLRNTFGFSIMMEKNIRANIAIVSHSKKGTPLDLTPYMLGTDGILDSKLARGNVRRYGGGFVDDGMDGTRIYRLMLAPEYSAGKAKLHEFENAPELPTPIVRTVKEFDDAVFKNADNLLYVLDGALQKDPDYFLRYEDVSSPVYFHKIDAMWLDHFIQLEPKANKIRDAIRQHLGVK
jgi:hypothetical protein